MPLTWGTSRWGDADATWGGAQVLELSDFDSSGLEAFALGLIIAGARETNGGNYRAVENGGPLGQLLSGSDFLLQTDQSITRVATRAENNSGQIRMWDQPSALRFDDFFTANPNATLRIRTEITGPTHELESVVQGGNFSIWSSPTAAGRTAVDGIGENDRYILAVAQPAAVAAITLDGQPLTANVTLSRPVLTATLTPRVTLSAVSLVATVTLTQPSLHAGAIAPVTLAAQALTADALLARPVLRASLLPRVSLLAQALTAEILLSSPSLQTTAPSRVTLVALPLEVDIALASPILNGVSPLIPLDLPGPFSRSYGPAWHRGFKAPAVSPLIVVDWEADGNFNSPIDDITADVLRWSFWRGRDFESIAGRATAGTASITVLNNTGKFSRSNSGSPLSGQLFEGAAVEIRGIRSGSAISRFFGYVRDVIPDTRGYAAQIEIDGAFSRLVNARVKPLPVSAGALPGALLNSVLDRANWPAGKRIIEDGQTVTGPYFPEETLAFDAIGDIEQTEGGLTFEDGAGNFVFQDRSFRLTGEALIPQATFSDIPGAPVSYLRSTKPDEPVRDVYNEVTVIVSKASTAATAVIWTFDDTLPSIPAGTSLIIVATYSDTGFINWLTPVIGTDVAATVPDSDLAVVVVKSSKEMRMTITNSAALPTTLTTLQARGSRITFTEYGYSTDDLRSIDRYGLKTYPLEVPYLADLNIAIDRAHAIVTQYAEPNPIIDVQFEIYSDELRDTLYSLEVSSRIRFIAQGIVTNLGFDTDFYVEGVRESRDYASGVHYVILELSSAAAYSGFFIWGISQWGVDTKWGF